MGEMQFHPACVLLPDMEADAYDALKKSIAKGFDRTYPIVLIDGKILDGRHRYMACIETGTKPIYKDYAGNKDPYEYTWDVHAGRRSWESETAKVLCYREMIEHSKAMQEKNQALQTAANAARSAAAKKRERKPDGTLADGPVVGTMSQPLDTTPKKKEAKARKAEAAMLGVGESAIRDANIIQSDPALAMAVRKNEISAAKAKKKVKNKKLVEKVKENIKIAVKAHPATISKADALKWIPKQPLADALITDPPYSTDVPDIRAFAESWLPLALSRVKSTGRAYVCIGAYPEELAAYFAVAMPTQILVWTYRNTMGPALTHGYKQNWQAILYYQMPDAPRLNCPELNEQFSVQDINAPDGRLGDRFHAWQKPMQLAERLVRHSTAPGDMIIDPFCCTGTFLLAASKLGRIAKGCDISKTNLAIAAELGCVYE